VLSLDVGARRIGVAVSDALRVTAQGLDTIERDDMRALEGIIKANDVAEIVVGLPLNMDGTKGERAEDTIRFTESLRERFNIPVKLWDERLSSMFVEKEMIRGDLSRKRRKKLSDKLAAQLILQNYLDSKSTGGHDV
jgi:putative Holliday junction resolvase